jgi:hypothetical protein
MLTVAIKGDYLGKAVVACESNSSAQGRGFATISWQLKTSGSGSASNVRRSIDGSIVDHYYLLNMLPNALHHICDVSSFVEGRN